MRALRVLGVLAIVAVAPLNATDGAGPSFGARKILRTLRGQDEIVACVRAGAPLQ